MATWRHNDKAKRLDNGRVVRVTDIRPNGLRVFYVTEDVRDGHTAIFESTQLRPLTGGDDHGDR